MPVVYFFEVVWKVACLREGAWQTGQCTLRSAVREFSDSLLLFGPNLLEVPDPYVHPDFNDLISPGEKSAFFDLSSSGYRTLPGEPRIMMASHGRRINARETLYELWEDSGLHMLAAEPYLIEPLIFCHAFKALFDHMRDERFSGISADNREYDEWVARAQLSIKKRSSRRIETVLISEARMMGKKGLTFGMDLYGDLRHLSVPESGVRYALLVPAEERQRGKQVPTGHGPGGLRAKTEADGSSGVTVRAPGEPERDYLVLPVKTERKLQERSPSSSLASGFLAHMTFYEEPSGLLWIF